MDLAFPPNGARKRVRRFGRLDSSRSEEGAGLGLALAESIAHLHQGKLLLDDNAPGLRTVLQLPVAPPPDLPPDRFFCGGARVSPR